MLYLFGTVAVSIISPMVSGRAASHGVLPRSDCFATAIALEIHGLGNHAPVLGTLGWYAFIAAPGREP